MNERECQWQIFVHNREAVIEALRRGECVGDTLFRSPYLLRLLGFNARHIEEGFYATPGQKPFDVESLGEFFMARCGPCCGALPPPPRRTCRWAKS